MAGDVRLHLSAPTWPMCPAVQLVADTTGVAPADRVALTVHILNAVSMARVPSVDDGELKYGTGMSYLLLFDVVPSPRLAVFVNNATTTAKLKIHHVEPLLPAAHALPYVPTPDMCRSSWARSEVANAVFTLRIHHACPSRTRFQSFGWAPRVAVRPSSHL